MVVQQMAHRLDVLYQFACQNGYNIYTDRSAYPDISTGFRDQPLVKPALYPGGEEQFPSIYDVHALAHFPSCSSTATPMIRWGWMSC